MNDSLFPQRSATIDGNVQEAHQDVVVDRFFNEWQAKVALGLRQPILH
jgi:hypothetical protein